MEPFKTNVRIHHGGVFVRDPVLRYSNGEVNDFPIYDIDKLHFFRIVKMVGLLGYAHIPKIY